MDHDSWLATHGLEPIEKRRGGALTPAEHEQRVQAARGRSQGNRAKAQTKGKESYRDAHGRKRATGTGQWKAENPARRAGKAAVREAKVQGRKQVERAGRNVGRTLARGALNIALGALRKDFDHDAWMAERGLEPIAKHPGHADQSVHAGGRGTKAKRLIARELGGGQHRVNRKADRKELANHRTAVRSSLRTGQHPGKPSKAALRAQRREAALSVGAELAILGGLAYGATRPTMLNPHTGEKLTNYGPVSVGRMRNEKGTKLNKPTLVVNPRKPKPAKSENPIPKKHLRGRTVVNSTAAERRPTAQLIRPRAALNPGMAKSFDHEAWAAEKGLSSIAKHPGHKDQSIHGGHGDWSTAFPSKNTGVKRGAAKPTKRKVATKTAAADGMRKADGSHDSWLEAHNLAPLS